MHAPTPRLRLPSSCLSGSWEATSTLSQGLLEDTAVTGPLPTSVQETFSANALTPPRPRARPKTPPPAPGDESHHHPSSTRARLRDPGPAWDGFLRNCTSGPSGTLSWGTPGGKGVVTAVAASGPTPAPPPRVLLHGTRDRS